MGTDCWLRSPLNRVDLILKDVCHAKSACLESAEELVHAFSFSRLDYCNGVFTGQTKKQKQKIHQTAAAKKVEHIHLFSDQCTGFL